MSQPSSGLPRNAWLTVALLWLVAFLNYLDRMTIVTMRNSLRSAIPMTDAQFGLLTTVFLVVYALFNPFGGYLADRFGRSRIIIFSLFAWSFVTYLTAHARSVDELLLTRALMGISEACYFSAAMALVLDYHPSRTRSLACGIASSGAIAGLAAGGLGGWLAERHGQKFVFEAFGSVGMVYALVLVLLLRDRPKAPSEAEGRTAALPGTFAGGLRSLLGGRQFRRMLLYFCIMGSSLEVVFAWMPTVFGELSHFRQGKAGLITTVAQNLTAFPGMLFSGVWGDRWSGSNPRGRNFVVVTGLVFSAVTLALVTHAPTVTVAVASLIAMGFFRSFIDPQTGPILSTVVSPKYLAMGNGMLNLVDGVVGGLMIYVTGALRDAQIGPRLAFSGAAAGLLVAAAVMWNIHPNRPE